MAVYAKLPTEIPDVYRVIVAGKVNTEIQKRETNTGRSVSNFRILYSYAKGRTPTDKGEPLSIRVSCWGEISDMADLLEKGDQIIVFGRMYINKYETEKYGKKSWEIDVEELIIPSCQRIAVEAHRIASIPTGGNSSSDPDGKKDGGLDDFDMASIDDIFPDSSL